MKKISKLFISLSLFATFLVGCTNNSASSSEDLNKDIKIESISFTLEYDSGYVNSYIQMHDLVVLPYDASNKKLEWSVEKPSLAEVIKDRIYLYEAGDTNVICRATDGSNVEFKKLIHINNLAAPADMEVESNQCVYIGEEVSPEVTFYPDSGVIDQRIEITVPEIYQDILEVTEKGDSVISKKVGNAKMVVTSKGNKNLSKEVDVLVEDDAFNMMKEDVTSGKTKYYLDFDSRKSVWESSFSLTSEDTWPSITLALNEPFNFSRQSVSVDSKCVSGHSWYEAHFLDINRDIVYREGHDNPKNNWVTNVFSANGDLEEDIYYVRFFANTGRSHASSIDTTATTYFDNFKIVTKEVVQIAYKSQELIIDCISQYRFSAHDLVYYPSKATEQAFKVSIKPGYEDYIRLIDEKTIIGLMAGDAYIIITSKIDPYISCEVKVHIVLENIHAKALHLYQGDTFQENIPVPFSLADNQDKTFCLAFKPVGDGTFGFTIGDHINKWKTVIPNVIISIDGGVPTAEKGTIVPSEEGWFIWKHLVSEFVGDGVLEATDITSIESNYGVSDLVPISLLELYIDIYGAYLE